MNFEINVKHIKIAEGKDNISKTIEELLSLNDLISAHTNENLLETTEKQLDSRKYLNKPSRGEEKTIVEFLLDDNRKGPVEIVQEVQIQEADPVNGGHRPREFNKSDKIRGHKKENISNIWLDVYDKEDSRKKDK